MIPPGRRIFNQRKVGDNDTYRFLDLIVLLVFVYLPDYQFCVFFVCRGGWAAGMPLVVGKTRSGLVAKCSGTPPQNPKLNTGRDTGVEQASMPAQAKMRPYF